MQIINLELSRIHISHKKNKTEMRNSSSGRYSKKRKATEVEVKEKDLDRFAGSSEEEGSDNEYVREDRSDNSEDDESDDVEKDEKVKLIDEEEMGNNKDDDELVEAPKASGTAGMASAMARILGHGTAKQQRTSSPHSTKLPSATSGGTASVVLSRTKTPLQRASEKEKQKEMLQKEKRKNNRQRSLTALHLPMTVATSLGRVKNAIVSDGLAQELERERTHRRVATRGVVALFNAISQHQNKPETESTTKGHSAFEKDNSVKKLTKHGFLDMIKSKAKSKKMEEEKATPELAAPRWNAMRDDFMMDSKKNWDQESSSSEGSVIA